MSPTTGWRPCAAGTGTCPGLTGMAGYTQLNPRTGALSQLVQFRGAIHPEELQTEPTVFSLISDAGNRATSVGLTRFMASPLTRAALCGSDYISHDDANKRAAHRRRYRWRNPGPCTRDRQGWPRATVGTATNGKVALERGRHGWGSCTGKSRRRARSLWSSPTRHGDHATKATTGA